MPALDNYITYPELVAWYHGFPEPSRQEAQEIFTTWGEHVEGAEQLRELIEDFQRHSSAYDPDFFFDLQHMGSEKWRSLLKRLQPPHRTRHQHSHLEFTSLYAPPPVQKEIFKITLKHAPGALAHLSDKLLGNWLQAASPEQITRVVRHCPKKHRSRLMRVLQSYEKQSGSARSR